MCNNVLVESHAVYEIMWQKNILEPDTPHMPVWHMIQIYTQNMSYLLLSTAMMIE
jgi:hypothetical protein